MNGTNIVLIVIDTLSAHHLSCYDYDKETAPFLSSLAEENLLFRFAYANAPWTVTSHASLFSGEPPSEHGTSTQNLQFTAPSFVEDLQDQGYQTIGISNNGLISEELGFDRGFDIFHSYPDVYPEANGMTAFKKITEKEESDNYSSKMEKYIDLVRESIHDRDVRSLQEGLEYLVRRRLLGQSRSGKFFTKDKGAEATNQIINDLDFNPPFFLFINFTEPHAPYQPYGDSIGPFSGLEDKKERFREVIGLEKNFEKTCLEADITATDRKDFQELYDAEIRYLDNRIRELYDHIQETTDKDTLFIITADHGEHTGENGLWGHQFTISEKLLRVPLILAGPDTPSDTEDQHVSLHNIGSFIQSREVKDLTTDRHLATYSGARGLDMDFSGDEHSKHQKNRSVCVIGDETGIILNSHLEDWKFDSGTAETHPLENLDEIPEHLLPVVQQQLEKETEGIDI